MNATGYRMRITSVDLITTECAQCGMVFAVPEAWDRNKRENGAGFYCPAGHRLHYSSENEALRAKVKRLEARRTHLLDQLDATGRERDAARRQASAYKGQVTKIRKRVGNGVCPCCNRTFADLARHMTTKHPGYRDGEVTA